MSERSTAARLAARDERLDDLRDVIGEPRPGAAIVPERIWEVLEARYERVVGPLIERTWPPDKDPENREHFLGKSRFIARRYASLAYVPVALAAASPLRSIPLAGTLQRLTLGTALGVAEPLVTRASASLVPVFLAAAPIDARTADLLAGLCTAYDQQFDDWAGDVDPVDRHHHIERLFRDPEAAAPGPEPASTALTRALLVELRAGLGERYEELADLGCEASAAEMRVELGEPDPESLSHRRAAAEGTVDAMMLQSDPSSRRSGNGCVTSRCSPSSPTTGSTPRPTWTCARPRCSPARSGSPEIEARWAELLAGSGSMLRACGISEPRMAELVEDGVRYVLWSGIDGMDRRIAD